ncbi:MAG: site-specific DNA-methyltransferase [Candidatus Kapabacteria bacterium]|nr:site-specific DNA-methyltransferase [Candidatus Kapabacteria bacterium]
MNQENLGLKEEKKLNTVDKYEFEPIKGYPMLHWKGKRPFKSTQYYPAQLKETYGESMDGWMNEIYWGDNLQVMSHLLKKYRGKVDLIYIDPPYDSKADYKRKISLKGKELRGDYTTFEEKQYTDIWTNDEYLQYMYERIILMRELLSDSGTLYLHCDWHKVHLIRCILDEIFGANNFLNEIIWYYRRWNIASNNFSTNHDNLLVYTKTKGQHCYNQLYIPKSEKSSAQGKTWKSVFDETGIRRSIMTDEETKGVPMPDTWEISMINPVAIERLGYPTQKPEALLERIMLASSNPGDLVFDCFMGSGTTQAVAMKLGRKFIGADINLGAIQTTTKRLLNVSKELPNTIESKYYTGFNVYTVNHYDVFRNPVQAKELLIEALEIQPLPGNNVYDGEKDGRFVKIMPINRIATRADLTEIISNFDYKSAEIENKKSPNKPVISLILVCMGHEPDLAAQLKQELKPYIVDVQVVDILRDKENLEFKRDSFAEVVIENHELVVKSFYPMNLLQKLSIEKENIEDWRELVESIMIDFNYDGSVLEPKIIDVPDDGLVKGNYKIPEDAGKIKIKITDLLSESLELEVDNG